MEVLQIRRLRPGPWMKADLDAIEMNAAQGSGVGTG